MSEPAKPRKPGKTGGCPMCGKPVDATYRPFCSKRCADLDLAKWLGDGYAIPSEDEPDTDPGSGVEE